VPISGNVEIYLHSPYRQSPLPSLMKKLFRKWFEQPSEDNDNKIRYDIRTYCNQLAIWS
jgi:hypothetical protein